TVTSRGTAIEESAAVFPGRIWRAPPAAISYENRESVVPPSGTGSGAPEERKNESVPVRTAEADGLMKIKRVAKPPPMAIWGKTIVPAAGERERSATGSVVRIESPRALVVSLRVTGATATVLVISTTPVKDEERPGNSSWAKTARCPPG